MNLVFLIDSVKLFNGLRTINLSSTVSFKVHSGDISSIQGIRIDSNFHQHVCTTMSKTPLCRS